MLWFIVFIVIILMGNDYSDRPLWRCFYILAQITGFITFAYFPWSCHIRLLQMVCRKFEFLYLTGNVLLYLILWIIMAPAPKSFGGKIMCAFGNALWLLSVFLYDTIPYPIFSQKLRAMMVYSLMFVWTIININNIFQTSTEELFGSWEINLGFKTWDLVDVYVSIQMNIAIFMGRMVWMLYYYPGHYILLRSVVKQQSLDKANLQSPNYV